MGVSISLFWYPNWKADCEYSEDQLERWAMESSADSRWLARRSESVDALTNLGFEEGHAVIALNKASDDVDAAAEALLVGPQQSRSADAAGGKHQQHTELPVRSPKGRWRKKQAQPDPQIAA